MLTTYQDLGRPEMLKYALSISGAMDQTSLQLINCLLNNPPGATALEVTLLGLKLKSMVHLQRISSCVRLVPAAVI
jgi:antagonist of KipI